MGVISISEKTSHCKISQRLQAARFVFRVVQSLYWSAISWALLPRCLLAFNSIQWFKLPILQLWYFARFYHKASYPILIGTPSSFKHKSACHMLQFNTLSEDRFMIIHKSRLMILKFSSELTHMVLKPKYLVRSRYVSRLLMHWLL